MYHEDWNLGYKCLFRKFWILVSRSAVVAFKRIESSKTPKFCELLSEKVDDWNWCNLTVFFALNNYASLTVLESCWTVIGLFFRFFALHMHARVMRWKGIFKNSGFGDLVFTFWPFSPLPPPLVTDILNSSSLSCLCAYKVAITSSEGIEKVVIWKTGHADSENGSEFRRKLEKK